MLVGESSLTAAESFTRKLHVQITVYMLHSTIVVCTRTHTLTHLFVLKLISIYSYSYFDTLNTLFVIKLWHTYEYSNSSVCTQSHQHVLIPILWHTYVYSNSSVCTHIHTLTHLSYMYSNSSDWM